MVFDDNRATTSGLGQGAGNDSALTTVVFGGLRTVLRCRSFL